MCAGDLVSATRVRDDRNATVDALDAGVRGDPVECAVLVVRAPSSQSARCAIPIGSRHLAAANLTGRSGTSVSGAADLNPPSPVGISRPIGVNASCRSHVSRHLSRLVAASFSFGTARRTSAWSLSFQPLPMNRASSVTAASASRRASSAIACGVGIVTRTRAHVERHELRARFRRSRWIGRSKRRPPGS